MPCKFQVGQRVRCVDNEGYLGELILGETYEVLAIRKARNIHNREGEGWFVTFRNQPELVECFERRFELVEEEKIMYRIGDLVRLDGYPFTDDVRGRNATVTQVRGDGRVVVEVDFDIREVFAIGTEELTMIAPVIEVGDRVRVNPLSPDFARYNGQASDGEGVVLSVGGDNLRDYSVQVDWDGGHRNGYRRIDLLRVGMVAATTQPEIKVEKFWMILRDDARQTQKRHASYEDVIAESKRLADENPENKFIILEALITVQKDDVTYKAEEIE